MPIYYSTWRMVMLVLLFARGWHRGVVCSASLVAGSHLVASAAWLKWCLGTFSWEHLARGLPTHPGGCNNSTWCYVMLMLLLWRMVAKLTVLCMVTARGKANYANQQQQPLSDCSHCLALSADMSICCSRITVPHLTGSTARTYTCMQVCSALTFHLTKEATVQTSSDSLSPLTARIVLHCLQTLSVVAELRSHI